MRKTFAEDKQHLKMIIVVSLSEHHFPAVWKWLSQKVKVRKVFLFRVIETDGILIRKTVYVKHIIKALFHRKKLALDLKSNETVVLVGHVLIPFLVHNYFALRRTKNSRVYVFALFFHNLWLMRLYGIFITKLSTPDVKFIAFSKADIPLFKNYFNLLDSQIVYVPYGAGGALIDIQTTEGDYCFAGGYSNRNYAFLIEAFRRLDETLIIVCSRQNKLPSNLPDNVQVFYDLPRDDFAKMIAGAKLCILPLHMQSGASGQSVVLQYMKYGKPIVATNVPVISDYLNDENAILVTPNHVQEFAQAIKALSVNKGRRNKLSEAAQRDYIENHQSVHFNNKILSVLLK